jgi:uncharacterized metal-binding protein YceD (DUF177 family)
MTEQLKIFTEQLQEGQKEIINLVLNPNFLELTEQEVKTPSPVHVEGEVYCIDDLLMLSLSFSTEIEMPCSICNKVARVPLQNKDIILSLPFSELPSPIFDYTQLLREEILILIPQFTECHPKGCPQRKELQPYLKTEDKKKPPHFPFADL